MKEKNKAEICENKYQIPHVMVVKNIHICLIFNGQINIGTCIVSIDIEKLFYNYNININSVGIFFEKFR